MAPINYKLGNGVARQYRNALASRRAGANQAVISGTMSLLGAANCVIEKSPRGGLCGLLCAYLAQQGFDLSQAAKKVMKNLEPEYQAIVDRAASIKKSLKK